MTIWDKTKLLLLYAIAIFVYSFSIFFVFNQFLEIETSIYITIPFTASAIFTTFRWIYVELTS